MTRDRLVVCLLVATLLGTAGAQAQDNNTLPEVRYTGCGANCARSTPPVTTDSGIAPYPKEFQIDGVEAFVRLRYTVGLDGAVKDVITLNLVGPQKFADVAIETVSKRKYVPATLDGKPAEVALLFTELFSLRDLGKEAEIPKSDSRIKVAKEAFFARSKVVSAYRDAAALIKANKHDEAAALLSDAEAEPNLNFYERGVLANLGAMIAIEKGDFLRARSLVELPTTFFTDKVPLEYFKLLMRSRLVADLNLGDVDDAITTAIRFKGIKGVDPADPLVKLAEDARAKADASPQYTMTKKLPTKNEGGGDYFPLFRRTFSFTVKSGALERYSLSCRQQVVESRITERAEWHVPKNWDGCSLLVVGQPGTVYQLNQFKD